MLYHLEPSIAHPCLARPNDRRVPKSFWDFKVAKDNLLNDLDILCRLLDHMSGKSRKELTQLYGLLLLLWVHESQF
jgi:hypothetical protein